MPSEISLLKRSGNFVGPLLFKPQDAPRYGPGFLAVLITAIITALLAVVYRFVCIWENRRRDKTGIMEGFEHAYEDDLTDIRVRSRRYPPCSFSGLLWLTLK